MTPTQEAAMRQALEALGSSLYPQPRQMAAMAALRAALAEPDEFIEDETIYCPTCGEEDGGTTCGMPDCGLRCGAEPMQEPVAWTGCNECDCSFSCFNGEARCLRLPPRKPLTEEEIKACEKQAMVNGALPFEQRVIFARAIEAMHGIR